MSSSKRIVRTPPPRKKVSAEQRTPFAPLPSKASRESQSKQQDVAASIANWQPCSSTRSVLFL
eukprot:scaffold2923_cov50-Attheya_sp.AAC.1